MIWLGTLLALLSIWLSRGRPRYRTLERGQTFPYISDIVSTVHLIYEYLADVLSTQAETDLKPLFITGATATAILYTITLNIERYLRHWETGRLLSNARKSERTLSAGGMLFSILGGIGLILLSVFDVRRTPNWHNIWLGVFLCVY